MKMKMASWLKHQPDLWLTLYPETSAERLLLDRLWGALQSRSYLAWRSVLLEMAEFTVFYNITEPGQAGGQDASLTPSISPEGSSETRPTSGHQIQTDLAKQ